MYKKFFTCVLVTFLALSAPPTLAQHSVSRQWNEALLTAMGSLISSTFCSFPRCLVPGWVKQNMMKNMIWMAMVRLGYPIF